MMPQVTTPCCEISWPSVARTIRGRIGGHGATTVGTAFDILRPRHASVTAFAPSGAVSGICTLICRAPFSSAGPMYRIGTACSPIRSASSVSVPQSSGIPATHSVANPRGPPATNSARPSGCATDWIVARSESSLAPTFVAGFFSVSHRYCVSAPSLESASQPLSRACSSSSRSASHAPTHVSHRASTGGAPLNCAVNTPPGLSARNASSIYRKTSARSGICWNTAYENTKSNVALANAARSLFRATWKCA